MAETIHARYSLRRATAAQWASSNEVLGPGEVGLETDTGRTKVGDGVAGWNVLDYSVSGAVANLSSIANGQVLAWSAAQKKFVPTAATGGGGGGLPDFHAQRAATQAQIKTAFVGASDVAYYWDFRDPACYADASGNQLAQGTAALSVVDCVNAFRLSRYSGLLTASFDPVAASVYANLTAAVQFKSTAVPNLATAWGGNHDMSVVARFADYSDSVVVPTWFALGYPGSNRIFAIGNNYSSNVFGAYRYGPDAQVAPAIALRCLASAGVKSGTSLMTYADGALVKTSASATSNITTNFMAIGGDGVHNVAVNGAYYGLFVINRALSAAEVAQLGTML